MAIAWRAIACLTGRDVGLPDKGGSGPTWLSRKEGAGLPRRRQRGRKVGGQVSSTQAWRCNPAPHNHKVGEVSGRRVSQAGGEKRLFPGSGDLLMQIAEKQQLPPFSWNSGR